jgi:hypothetical protein
MSIVPFDLCPSCSCPKHTGEDCEFCPCTAALSRKANTGKISGWTLLPWESIAEEAEVYAYGAKKYEAHSWRKAENALQVYTDAMFRHLAAYLRGEERDPESGLRHVAHARWNLGAIMELTRR